MSIPYNPVMKRMFSVLLAVLTVSCSDTAAPSVASAAGAPTAAAPAAAPVAATPATETAKAALKTAAGGTIVPAAKKEAPKPQPAPTTEQTQEQRSILSTETIL